MPDGGYGQAEMNALAVLQALGDETRYVLYRELAGSPRPLGAPQLAERLGLHANTVRMHLERMREAGLVEVEAVHRGTVGRPQHVYTLASNAPGLDFDPPAHAVLAGLLAALAERLGGDGKDAEATGRAWGRDAVRRTRSGTCVEVLVNQLTQLGFDPAVERRRRRHQDLLPPVPLPGPRRGVSRARLQPAPRHHRRRTRAGGLRKRPCGKDATLLDVVRPRSLPRPRGRRVVERLNRIRLNRIPDLSLRHRRTAR